MAKKKEENKKWLILGGIFLFLFVVSYSPGGTDKKTGSFGCSSGEGSSETHPSCDTDQDCINIGYGDTCEQGRCYATGAQPCEWVSNEPDLIEGYDLAELEGLDNFEPFGCNLINGLINCGRNINGIMVIGFIEDFADNEYPNCDEFIEGAYSEFGVINSKIYKSVSIYDLEDNKYICESSGGTYENNCKCPITHYNNFVGECNKITALDINKCEALSTTGVNCYNAAPHYAEWDYFHEGICECQFGSATSYVEYWNVLNCDTTCNPSTGCSSFCPTPPFYEQKLMDKLICTDGRMIVSTIGTNSNLLENYIDEYYTCN